MNSVSFEYKIWDKILVSKLVRLQGALIKFNFLIAYTG